MNTPFESKKKTPPPEGAKMVNPACLPAGGLFLLAVDEAKKKQAEAAKKPDDK